MLTINELKDFYSMYDSHGEWVYSLKDLVEMLAESDNHAKEYLVYEDIVCELIAPYDDAELNSIAAALWDGGWRSQHCHDLGRAFRLSNVQAIQVREWMKQREEGM